MDVRSLIPKDKFGDSTMDRLLALTDAEIAPIMYDLLEWLQDYNWPVAQGVLDVVIRHQAAALPHLPRILNGADVMWKIWIMELLLPALTGPNRAPLLEDVRTLAALEGDDEDMLAVKEAADWCLEECFEPEAR